MRELEIQKFLRAGGTVAEIEEAGIRVATRGDLTIYKYSHIGVKWTTPYAKECRGIILHKDTHEVIAYPFDKFWNVESEGLIPKIDWDSAIVWEKMDGSLLNLFCYDDEWRVSTSGSADATGNVYDHDFKFHELFWRIVEENNYDVTHDDLKDYTFMFELTSVYNRIVLPYKDSKLTMLAVRNNRTYQEEHIDEYAKRFKTPVPQRYALDNVIEIKKTFADMTGVDGEGYVVCDGSFNRVKIKSPTYVALHHLIGKMGDKWIVESVRNGETKEVLDHFPEYTERFNKILSKYNELVDTSINNFNKIKHIENRKEFALAAKEFPVQGALFYMKSRSCNCPKEHFKDITLNNMCKLLDVKEKPKKTIEE